MMGSEGPAVQADSTWYSERRVVRPTAIVADLTVPVVRAAVARQRRTGLPPTLRWRRQSRATPCATTGSESSIKFNGLRANSLRIGTGNLFRPSRELNRVIRELIRLIRESLD